jgi:hypothetical protein
MLEPHEAEMLGRVDANVCQLLANDRDKEIRLKSLEASHNKLQGSIKATQVISGGLWATFLAWISIGK